MKDPILFLVGAAVVGSLAMNAGLVAPQPSRCPATTTVVQYLPMPEPAPLYVIPPLGWPVLERQREAEPEPAKAVEEVKVEEDAQPERPHRRRWRHYRRHR